MRHIRFSVRSSWPMCDEAAVRLLARLPSGASRKICGTKTEEIRMGGRGKADRQAPRFAHREDEGVVVGSQQSDEKEDGVKKAPCACRWELLSPLSTHGSCISYMTDSVCDRPTIALSARY